VRKREKALLQAQSARNDAVHRPTSTILKDEGAVVIEGLKVSQKTGGRARLRMKLQ
jgi:hypothetical protein